MLRNAERGPLWFWLRQVRGTPTKYDLTKRVADWIRYQVEVTGRAFEDHWQVWDRIQGRYRDTGVDGDDLRFLICAKYWGAKRYSRATPTHPLNPSSGYAKVEEVIDQAQRLLWLREDLGREAVVFRFASEEARAEWEAVLKPTFPASVRLGHLKFEVVRPTFRPTR